MTGPSREGATGLRPGADPPAADEAEPPAGWRRWVALPVLLTGTAMVVLDTFIVNVATPSTEHDLHAGPTAVEWITAGYSLAFAAGLITSGRLGDHVGRRRMFVWGLALFTVTSTACGVAPSAGALIAARIAQGVGAAAVIPQVTAILRLTYHGADRVRAFMLYALTLGGSAIAGQLIGGALIQADVAALGWRSCFLVNVPVGAVGLVLARRLVPESRVEGAGELDVVGAVSVTAALVAVVLPLVEGRGLGWPAWSWACLAASPLLCAAVAAHQRRRAARGANALVPPALFGERAFGVGLAGVLLFYGSVASSFLMLALYLQEERGLSPLGSGLLFSVLGAGFLAASMVSGKLTARFGRVALVTGVGIRAAALAGMWAAVGHVGAHGSVAWLAAPLVADGVGQGLVTGPLLATVLAHSPPRHAGAASGVLSATQQVGNALGVAAVGGVFFGAVDAGHRMVYAYQAGLAVLVAVSLVVVALIRCLPRGGSRT